MSMTQREAFGAAERIVKTWPNGPRQSVWSEVLIELEEAPARKAYEHLRDFTERPPSVAAFLADYRARIAQDRPAGHPLPYCALCDGCGWRAVTTAEAHVPEVCHPTEERPCDCHAARPCECTAGRRAAETGVHRRIVEANARGRYHGPPVPPPVDAPTTLALT